MAHADMSNDRSGQKAITAENFAQPDSRILYFFRDPEVWVRRCQEPTVASEVPQNVATLLEIAQGTISYGWFYYPLLSVGVEQCSRCLEAAARERCKSIGIAVENTDNKGNLRPMPFANLIAALRKRGLLTDEDANRWDVGRDLRNIVAHPNDQLIFTPDQVLGHLKTTIKLINRLFQR